MTSPDNRFPDGAYSGAAGSRSIARLGGQTQQSMQTAMRAQVMRAYADIPYNFAKAVQAGLHELAAALCDAITGFTGGLINLGDWARASRARAQEAREQATTARDSADVAEEAVVQTGEVVQATNSQVQVIIDGLPVKPYWDSMNLTEEASFPRCMLHRRVWDHADVAKPGYVPYSYTYVAYYDVNGYPVYADHTVWARYEPSYTPPTNALDGAFIRCRYSGGRKVVTFIVDEVSNPCELYVVVGRMVPNGDIRIEWVSPNQTPSIANSRFERSVELPNEVVFDVGETAFIGIHQRGGGNPRPLLGTNSTDLPRAPSAWPPRPSARFATSAALVAGSTLAAGSMSFNSNSVPYVALSKSLIAGPPSKLVYYENFDSGSLPVALGRVSSLPATVSGGVFVVSGGSDGIRRYLYGQTLNYDDVMVTGRIISPSVRHAWLMLRSTPDNKRFVSLNVTQSIISICKYDNGVWTALSSVEIAIVSGDVVRLRATNNLFTAQRKTASGWDDVLTYTDTTGTLPTGPGTRYTGLGNERADWVNGGGWDYWKAEDL
ncbi:hypothetical protein ACFWU5_26160 [Nocardia sp. NPDC058640]|uniref:hypothetical protein n=1 Tax=Nocardia sp. NPDC058640 TaxID=3346571 RepID=UPI003656556A